LEPPACRCTLGRSPLLPASIATNGSEAHRQGQAPILCRIRGHRERLIPPVWDGGNRPQTKSPRFRGLDDAVYRVIRRFSGAE